MRVERFERPDLSFVGRHSNPAELRAQGYFLVLFFQGSAISEHHAMRRLGRTSSRSSLSITVVSPALAQTPFSVQYKVFNYNNHSSTIQGAPSENRTRGFPLRRRALCPAELQWRIGLFRQSDCVPIAGLASQHARIDF